MSTERPHRPIEAIQCLRGVAALMVVAHHLQTQTARLGLAHVSADALQSGVDIFFVISGFIMWVTTAGRPERTAGRFYRDRLVRVVPLYWAMTALVVAVMLVAPAALSTSVLDGGHIVRSLLFMPAPHPVTGTYFPTLIPGWTLNLEMFFYLLFGGAMFVAGGRTRLRAALMASALVMLVAIGVVVRPTGVLAFYTQGMLIEFAAGIAVGLAYVSGKVPRSKWWWGLAASGAVALATGLPHPFHVDRALAWGAPAAAIVGGLALGPPLSSRPLKRLGDWSYALYLSHQITLAACHKAWLLLPAGVPAELFAPVAIGCAIGAAGLIFRFVEEPASQAIKAQLAAGVVAPGSTVTSSVARRSAGPSHRSLK